MNEPGEIPLTNADTPDTKPCSLISIIPTIGMSSCRGRAEAFARRLSSKLRTLGSQADDEKDLPEDEPIINGITKNTWMPSGETDIVTELQPGRHENDSFFDYDCDLESPGSPVDECEYLRLIETASNTPHNSAAESGYACGSATSSHCSNDDHCNNSNMNMNYGHDTTDDYSKYVNVMKPNNYEHQLNNEFNSKSLTTNDLKDLKESLENEANEVKNSLLMNHNINKNLKNQPVNGSECQGTEANHLNHPDLAHKITHVNGLEGQSNGLATNEHSHATRNGNSDEMKTEAKQTFPLTTAKYFFQKDEDMVKIQNDILQELHINSTANKHNESQPLDGSKDVNDKHQEEHQGMENGTTATNGQATAQQISDIDEHLNKNGDDNGDGDETLSIRGDSSHTYTFHSTLTNGQQSQESEEVLKIEVTAAEQNVPTHLKEPLSVDVSESQFDRSSLLAANSNEKSASQSDISPLSDDGHEYKENSNENQDQNQNQVNNSRQNQTATNETTDDEEDCRPQRVRRCSSLKTGKTPPGTPGRKKIVRFADVLGLDLADVKTFLDEIPTIPKSAFMDLEIMENEPPIQLGPRSDKLLMPLFQQPGGLPTFLDIVREKQVSLENATVSDVLNQTITGIVRVRNLDFHKSVYIRYTMDNWRSFADLQANYIPNSCDGFSDKFSFVIFGNSLQIGQRLELAVRFQCKGQQFWDNNYGTNYCFQCLAACNPLATTVSSFVPAVHPVSNVVGLLSPTAGDAWCNSFY